MKKIVFCEIAWMKYYAGVYDGDIPKNGGKYIKEYNDGGEVYNFTPYNHKCYGYVMHYGRELHIERYDKILKCFDEVSDMTVVWVASNGNGCKIVGWYEYATMYRYWQDFYDPYSERQSDYNFVANEKDCYLINEEDRDFVIPRAPIVGKGKGMGQSQVWYADSEYAQKEFIPKVFAYLASMREKCTPFYFTEEEMLECAKDNGESVEELLDKGIALYNDEEQYDVLGAFALVNLAVKKDDCYETRVLRAKMYKDLKWYNEAEEEFKKALHHDENLEAIYELMCVERMLGNTLFAVGLGEMLRRQKEKVENWTEVSEDLALIYIEKQDFDSAQILIRECENDKDKEYDWIEDVKDILEEEIKKERIDMRN